ncbi:MAG: DUF1080 domain-containing protein [Opitutae bacterium]|nr:DUF1080 domain-containing protein [Opitutae bacterium]
MKSLPDFRHQTTRCIHFITCLALTSILLPHSPIHAKKKGDGFVSLFNNENLDGWITPSGEHDWKVIDGVIDYEARGGNLTTKKSFRDYILQIEWRFKRTAGPPYNAKLFDADGNVTGNKPVPNADSGIFVRGSGKSQVNLWCWPCGSGQLWAFHRNEDPVIRKGAMPRLNTDKKVGQWNEMEITMKGETLTVVLNEKTVIKKSKMPGVGTEGPIVLQHHGGYNEKSKTWSSASALIQFRNIHIKEL